MANLNSEPQLKDWGIWRCSLLRRSCLVLNLWVVIIAVAACSPAHYRKSADKEVYGTLQQKEKLVFGKTNEFAIDTPYSSRKPEEIPAAEIIHDRYGGTNLSLSLKDAFEIALTNSRNYQFRKEGLYLASLALTRNRYDFRPKFFAGVAGSFKRENGENSFGASPQVGVDQLMKSGATLGVTLANDLFRYYSGDPKKTATTILTANLVQPLMRGAGASIVAENLTQSERDLVYEIRSFSRFQKTFGLEIVTSYYRLLQQQDAVRNEYANYQNLIVAGDRAKMMAETTLPKPQADQALQDEYQAKSRYIIAIENYQSRLDAFKKQLGLPMGTEIHLDENALKELEQAGFTNFDLTELSAFHLAVDRRMDLLNEIDRFEDSKRKIKVAANQLKMELNLFADYSLQSDATTDYANFNFNNYRGGVGVELNLPLDRLRERNNYRATLIQFERQIRALALALDQAREDIRNDFRRLQQASQNYEIQKSALELAYSRVESSQLFFDAGRVHIRDLLEAQSAQLRSQNAVTQALIDYHLARLTLLVDLEGLDTGKERFWLARHDISGVSQTEVQTQPERIVPTPEQLFQHP